MLSFPIPARRRRGLQSTDEKTDNAPGFSPKEIVAKAVNSDDHSLRQLKHPPDRTGRNGKE